MTNDRKGDGSSDAREPTQGAQESAGNGDSPVISMLKNKKQSVDHSNERKHEPKHPVDIAALGVAILALLIAGIGAYIATLQYGSMEGQQKIMQGQLDEMFAQQRPWISATPKLVFPIIFWHTKRGRDISVPVSFELKNFGQSPATNIVISSRVIPYYSGASVKKLNAFQDELCIEAEKQSSESEKIGITVFPGQSKPAETSTSAGDFPMTDDAILYSVEGCIDYTYGANLHGKTGYRMLFGHINNSSHLWEGIIFIKGTEKIPGADDDVVIYRMPVNGLDFKETDDGGNWAK